ncbi:MAG TPA: stimulus-sensing domain-containing protein [Stellaceae bacterium]|jgi:two-component system sensor histidine kinase ChvG|nr:stimulus-sensing domain-containing protein [Stellaceae bacterium]
MASVIDIANTDAAAPAPPGINAAPDGAAAPSAAPPHAPPRAAESEAPRRRRHWPRLSPLTRRIIAVNVLPLALLALGFLYLGKFEASLVDQQVEALRTQGEIFAAALGEGAVLDSPDEGEQLLPDLARHMMRRLVAPTHTPARLFDRDGKLIADSKFLAGPGDAVEVAELPPPDNKGTLSRLVDRTYDWIARLLPQRRTYAAYRGGRAAADFPEVERALHGEGGSEVRRDAHDKTLVITVAVPVQSYKEVLGAVMLSSVNGDIEAELRNVRFELLRIFAVALLVTLLLSVYLAGTIARPIHRLAEAAERAQGRGARVDIPDFTQRGDEIGDLSRSLREMTNALFLRMSAIESFASDVAHEIKNPLSSLRSAVETAVRIDDPVKQQRLLAIILDDVERLSRLITDISDASRLDAELSRDVMEPIDLTAMLRMLVDIHETTRRDGTAHVVLTLPERRRALFVSGSESRLSQVFLNVVANAVSFSPPGAEIRVAAREDGRGALVTVEDDGPGIPPEKLTTIFDRFYTERPAAEKFGTHSGLGLSISKQIVEVHRGRIWAENRRDASGAVCGARFLIRLPEA